MDTYYTDENGQFTTGYYVCGDDWTIREISPSEDYLLDGTVYLKPRLVQIANAVIKSDKYPECKERYGRSSPAHLAGRKRPLY